MNNPPSLKDQIYALERAIHNVDRRRFADSTIADKHFLCLKAAMKTLLGIQKQEAEIASR